MEDTDMDEKKKDSIISLICMIADTVCNIITVIALLFL